jgi:hypothetical protein
MGDPDRVPQIQTNLLANAPKPTNHGSANARNGLCGEKGKPVGDKDDGQRRWYRVDEAGEGYAVPLLYAAESAKGQAQGARA